MRIQRSGMEELHQAATMKGFVQCNGSTRFAIETLVNEMHVATWQQALSLCAGMTRALSRTPTFTG